MEADREGEMDKAKNIERPAGGYLEGLLQGCPDAIIAIDGKGLITFANNAACELLECEMRDLVGKSIVNIYESEDRARETNRKLYLSGGIIHCHESVAKTKTGKLIPTRISGSHMKDSSGNVVGSVGFFQAYRPWTAAESKMQEYAQELEARLKEWEDLGSPVFELWPGISMAVVVGRLDNSRFAHLKRTLLDHIKINKTRVALIDLTSAVAGDAEVPAQLVKTLRMIRLVGAQCVVVGIESTTIAEALESLLPDMSSMNTYSSLEAGVEAALAMVGSQISRKT
jgi:PAS domain S-box-containing protein